MEGKQNISGVAFKEKLNKMETEIQAPITYSTSLEDIQDVYLPENSTHLSVTTVLNYCKSKILNPYLKFLSFVGLRPLISEEHVSCCLRCLSHLYFVQGILLIIAGYVLQYMACFRRDRGFYYLAKSEKLLLQENANIDYELTCNSSAVFSFVIPSIMHLAGYLHSVIVTRRSDDEQIPVLMERVFLLSTHLASGFIRQKKLVRTLWAFITCSIIWMVSSFALVNYMMTEGEIYFKWTSSVPGAVIILKIFTIVATLWHDIVCATIISNYCLQAQLLNSYVQFLREKLLQCPVQPLQWMREIEEFKKLLNYLNEKMSLSVCLLTIVNLSYSTSGLLWLFHFDWLDRGNLPVFGISLVNIFLWIFISAVPFIQAARLSSSCEVLQAAGQEARAKPYVHLDTPISELDSVLLYTTSLKINAKLYHIPVTGRNLCFCIVSAVIIVLVLGQLHYFSKGNVIRI